jgi:hypothetical protein
MDPYTKELFDESVDPEEAAKSVVRKLNAEIEKRLFELTVNAADWFVSAMIFYWLWLLTVR